MKISEAPYPINLWMNKLVTLMSQMKTKMGWYKQVVEVRLKCGILT